MVGIHEGPTAHLRDVDRVMGADSLSTPLLRDAILNTGLSLRMKSPPPPRALAKVPDKESIRVEVVQSESQLRQCFNVRHAVYGEIMRYLPDEIIGHRARVEIDYFDTCSIHFAGVRESTGDVVSTMRLVLNYPTGKAARLTGSQFLPPFALLAHCEWCKRIANRVGSPFSARVKAVPREFGSFPILLSTDFRRNQRQVIDEALFGSELSRLVILPAYRGYGISRTLINAAIAKAAQLKRRSLLLECVPKHVEMYAKHGFKRLDGAPHSRPSDLDQYAIGMRLCLVQNDVANRARLFLQQILEKKDDFQFVHYGPFDVPPDVPLSSSTPSELNEFDSAYF
jgi:GNAT superfamily N-acetyltransferase